MNLEAIMKAVEVIQKLYELAKLIQEVSGDSEPSEFDRLMNEVLALRNDLLQVGNTILRELEESRVLMQDIELNRITSLAQTALNVLQTARVVEAEKDALRALALRDSENAVVEMFNSADFLDRAPWIGPFTLTVNIRLQVLREIIPNFYEVEPFRSEIANWANLLERVTNEFDAAISGKNKIHEFAEYEIDLGPPKHKVYVGTTFSYENISGTHRYHAFVETRDELSEARSIANSVRRDGIAEDQRRFGIPLLRELVLRWRTLGPVTSIRSLSQRLLQRPLTASETADLLKQPDLLTVDPRIKVLSMIQSSEFNARFLGLTDTQRAKSIDQECRRLMDESTPPEIAESMTSIAKNMGFKAFLAAMLFSEEHRGS